MLNYFQADMNFTDKIIYWLRNTRYMDTNKDIYLNKQKLPEATFAWASRNKTINSEWAPLVPVISLILCYIIDQLWLVYMIKRLSVKHEGVLLPAGVSYSWLPAKTELSRLCLKSAGAAIEHQLTRTRVQIARVPNVLQTRR